MHTDNLLPLLGKEPRKKRCTVKTHSKCEAMERLIVAAEHLLETHGHLKATERSIASIAGVNVAMIHYYFGGKEGLIFAVADRYSMEVKKKFEELHRNIDLHQRDATSYIFKTLINAYYARPWLTRIMAAEITRRDSAMTNLFLKRYGPRGLVEIKKVFDHLVDAGIYDPNMNTKHAALAMYSMVLGPIGITPIIEAAGTPFSDLSQDGWINFVVSLFDRQFRPVSS